MRCFLFFLFVFTPFLAQSNITAVTENDPSTLVEGVSVITGDFCMHSQMYTAQGAEPVHLNNVYISEGVCLAGHEHAKAESVGRIMVCIREPYGTVIEYELKDWEKKLKHENKNSKSPWVYTTHNFIAKSSGITNTASGNISALTHLKNQRIVFDPKEDFSSFIFHASDGTMRHYGGRQEIKETEIIIGRSDSMCVGARYFLMQEDLPNGHVLRYVYHNNEICEIRSTNKSGTKVFASIQIKSPSRGFAEYTGSDGQKGTLRAVFSEQGKKQVFEKICSPDAPDLSFSWIARRKMVYLTSFFTEIEKQVRVHYNMDCEYTKPTVSHLEAPVGKDAALLTTHRFIYKNNKTDVFDIEGNKTTYLWNNQERLTAIQRFIGSDTLYSEERFAWNGPLLVSKSFWDEKGVCKSARSFEYDQHGNITKSYFSGNLTGHGKDVILKPDGSIDCSQTECYIVKTTYSNDGKHLPLWVEEPSGLTTIYTYVPGTNLVKTKTLYDLHITKIVYTYDYDEDFLLIKETVDDGVSCKIKRIHPKQNKPFLGKIVDDGVSRKTKRKRPKAPPPALYRHARGY